MKKLRISRLAKSYLRMSQQLQLSFYERYLFKISFIGDVHLIFCDLITRMFTGLVSISLFLFLLFSAGPILRTAFNTTLCCDGA